MIKNGQIYTPNNIVKRIWGGVAENFRYSHILDNSCGDGAFLTEIVRQYIENWMTPENTDEIVSELETYIHGVEIDCEVKSKCIANLDSIAREYGLKNIKWDVICGNALTMDKFNGKMDYVVGNPPYIRIHDIVKRGEEEDYKKYSFMQRGMADSFLAFFELGLRQCKPDGKLAYIAPTSWFTSLAGKPFRELLSATHWLKGIVDLSLEKIFKGVTTYPAIVFIDKSKTSESISYQEGDSNPLRLTYKEITFDGMYYFGTAKELYQFGCILKHKNDNYPVEVKNGFATLADKVFVDDCKFSNHCIPVLKASRGIWDKAFYPYAKDGFLIREDILREDPEIDKFLTENKDILSVRKIDGNPDHWYAYGRRQAIKDVYCNKVGVSALIKDKESFKISDVPAGSGIYAGLYILTNDVLTSDFIKRALVSDEFVSYVKILRKYKSGGFYTFSSKDVTTFLNWKISKNQ